MPETSRVRSAYVAAWWSLLTWQVIWHALLPPPMGSQSPPLALGLAVPLLLLTRPALRSDSRGRFWAMFLVMAYFMGGVTEAWSNPSQRIGALVQVGLCCAWFALMGRISRRPKANR
ncbi:MAG: DUF2069 domain-containing protein [Xanthomonadales bacterium]|nr:DUF2069 domain-containing protein [Xanthomonadales bacterium]